MKLVRPPVKQRQSQLFLQFASDSGAFAIRRLIFDKSADSADLIKQDIDIKAILRIAA